MTAFDDLPEGWRVWNDGEDGAILVYRPDVFDTQQFPAPCLPTVRVARRPPTERKRRSHSAPDSWFVSLRLEPEVRVKDADARFDSRDAADAAAVDLAARFHAGDVDYRGAYQIPRDDYLDELDDLTG